MCFDLNGVLNLDRIWAANPNGVALPVYAAGLGGCRGGTCGDLAREVLPQAGGWESGGPGA